MGNIGFDSGRYGPDSPFVQAACRKLDSMEKLDATLNEAEKELFEQYCDAQGDIEGITRNRGQPDRKRLKARSNATMSIFQTRLENLNS